MSAGETIGKACPEPPGRGGGGRGASTLILKSLAGMRGSSSLTLHSDPRPNMVVVDISMLGCCTAQKRHQAARKQKQ